MAEKRGAFAGTSLQRTYAPAYNWVLHGKWLAMIGFWLEHTSKLHCGSMTFNIRTPIGVSKRGTCVRGDVLADNHFPVGPYFTYIFGLGIFEPALNFRPAMHRACASAFHWLPVKDSRQNVLYLTTSNLAVDLLCEEPVSRALVQT